MNRDEQQVDRADGDSPVGAGRPVGPVDAMVVPRYAGPSTFARLPTLDSVPRADLAVLGVPFDSGVSYRPGARFGPSSIRDASRLLRTGYAPALDVEPFASQQVVDAGDVAANPFSIHEALDQIRHQYGGLCDAGMAVVTMGGDHTVTLACLRALVDRAGPVSLLHFDAHLDTWDTYFGAPHTHGTFLRRAAEEGLFAQDSSMHIGIRGPLYHRSDLATDADLGFRTISCPEVAKLGTDAVIDRIRDRVGTRPVYVSVDIDVLDPAFAPGTGTPEVGGLQTRELLDLVRGLTDLPLLGGDVVEVSPPYDHSDITSLAAATLVFEFVSLFAIRQLGTAPSSLKSSPSAGPPGSR